MLLYTRRRREAEAGEPVQWPPIFVVSRDFLVRFRSSVLIRVQDRV
jgi:hypothetical protein